MNQLMVLIALADAHGADAALSEAIERGLLLSDQHIESDEYAEAKAEAEDLW
jgi:hypothetical protein